MSTPSVKYIWQAYSHQASQGIALILIVSLAFVGGLLYGQDQPHNENKVVINIPDYQAEKAHPETEAETSLPLDINTVLPEPVAKQDNTPLGIGGNQEKSCPYVGSKNSNKYHLSTCGVTKRIKPENRRCFASEEMARASGYVAGCVQ